MILRYHREDDYEFRTGNSYYGDYKYDTEKLVYQYHDKGKISATIIRPSNVIGPGSIWVTNTIDVMQKSAKYPMIDSGVYNASLVYVENLVDGVMLTLQKDAARGRQPIISVMTIQLPGGNHTRGSGSHRREEDKYLLHSFQCGLGSGHY